MELIKITTHIQEDSSLSTMPQDILPSGTETENTPHNGLKISPIVSSSTPELVEVSIKITTHIQEDFWFKVASTKSPTIICLISSLHRVNSLQTKLPSLNKAPTESGSQLMSIRREEFMMPPVMVSRITYIRPLMSLTDSTSQTEWDQLMKMFTTLSTEIYQVM